MRIEILVPKDPSNLNPLWPIPAWIVTQEVEPSDVRPTDSGMVDPIADVSNIT